MERLKKYPWAYHQIECLLPFINTQKIQQSYIDAMIYSQGQKKTVSN